MAPGRPPDAVAAVAAAGRILAEVLASVVDAVVPKARNFEIISCE